MALETFRDDLSNEVVQVFKVPDFDELIVGREVGWNLREIELPEDEIPASATNLRNNLKRPIWISGRPSSGKTTLAMALQARLGKTAVVLDGDAMRHTIATDLDLSDEGRMENNHRIAALARELTLQGLSVICATVSPTPEIRTRVGAILNPQWVFTDRKDEVPEPENFSIRPGAILLHMDTMEPEQAVTHLLELLAQEGEEVGF